MAIGCFHTPCLKGLREPCENISLHVVLTSRFVVAEFSGGADILENFHVAEVTEEGGVIVVASHSTRLHLAQVFNLMQESFGFEPLSFRSWLEKMQNAVEGKEANFAGSVTCHPDLLLSSLFQRFLPCGWAAWC